MITCHSVQRIKELDFGSYLMLPQYSHSFLRYEKNGFNEQKKATDKMRLGSLVDALMTGGSVDMTDDLYVAATHISRKLSEEFSWVLPKLQKQVSLTGIMRLDAGKAIFEMPIKGRPDYSLPAVFILDLKITKEPVKKIDSLIPFMGYPNQGFCYGKLEGVLKVYLLIYSTRSKEAIVKSIPIGDTNRFWEEKILKFGKVI